MIAWFPAGGPGRRRLRTALACGLAGAMTLAAALAGDAHTARRVRNDPEAVRLLRAAADAALRVRYEGTQFLTTWNGAGTATHRVKVEHRPGDGTYFDPDSAVPASQSQGQSQGQGQGQSQGQGRPEVPPSQGSAPGLRAAAGADRAYQPDTLPVWNGSVGFTAEILGLLIRNYTVVRGPYAAVCGRRARVVEARRVDGTVAGRFWIDTETGLMLHRELIDTGGRAVAVTGFSELRVSRAGQDEPLTMTSAQPAGSPPAALPWTDRLEDGELAALRDQGWPVPGALPGRLTLYDARRPGTEERPGVPGSGSQPGGGPQKGAAEDGIVHLSYSDGLAAVSVFVQRGSLDESTFSGWRRTAGRGRTVFRRDSLQHWAVWARDGYVYTVLTDAPPDTTDSVVDALPRGEDAFRARLGRGFRRLSSWISPSG